MKSNKGKITALLSVLLVAAVAIGGTLAYLSTTTETKKNVFTFAENIRAELPEPNWDPENGKNLKPGSEVKKDPMIKNTSANGLDEFVAIKLTFSNGAGTTQLNATETARLLACLDIAWNVGAGATQWTRTTGTATAAEQVFVYNSVLPVGMNSAPVFHSVKVKENIADAELTWLAGVILNHTDACWEFNSAHTTQYCTLSYKHHVNCATPNSTTAKGVGGCTCTPAENHVTNAAGIAAGKVCPSLEGTLKASCTHTVPAGSIAGFQINVSGSAVQAGVDGMTAPNTPATVTALTGLFS